MSDLQTREQMLQSLTLETGIREKVAEAIENVTKSDGYSHKEFCLASADAAIATLLAELDTPSDEMVVIVDDAICKAERPRMYKLPSDRTRAAIQAIAEHLRASQAMTSGRQKSPR